MQILDTVIGGLLALAGSIGVQMYVLRYTLRTKMDEAMAAKKVIVNAEAYKHIKHVEGAHQQAKPEQTLREAAGYETWFFSNRLFLPGDFAEHWLTMMANLRQLARPSTRSPEESEKINKEVQRAISAAIEEIYKDAGIPRPRWERKLPDHPDEPRHG